MKLFAWSVNHIIQTKNKKTVRRNEKGVARASDRDQAINLLKKSVCTQYSKDLVVVEIPEKINVYSIVHHDAVLNAEE